MVRATHESGDFFSIEHICPTYLLSCESYVALLNMPGAFVLTRDNSRFGEAYSIISAWWLTQCFWPCWGWAGLVTAGI